MNIELLQNDRLNYWCQRLKMPSEAVDALTQVSHEIKADPRLLGIFSEFYQATTIRGEWHKDWSPLSFDPLVLTHFEQRTSLFYLLAYLAALPAAEEQYHRLGICSEIFDATMYDLTFYTLQATDVHGYWRFDQFMWVWRHLTCQLFRLGRLQFMLIPYQGHATAFRNLENGEILLLCGPQIALRADGYAFEAGKTEPYPPDQSAWYAVYEDSAQGWTGCPVSPYGYALREPVFLPRTAWECILRQGDTVLDIHIPRGKTLTEEECRESFTQAYQFFSVHWPEKTFSAAFCHTWFFTPQLQSLLPPTSSIVHFQREFYLYPGPGGPGFLWSFVFGEKYPDPATAPRDTSLRRAVLDWLSNGKELFDLPGVMFHSPEAWGSQPYMSHWDRKNNNL